MKRGPRQRVLRFQPLTQVRAPSARNLVWLAAACMPAVAQDATISRPYHLVPTFNVSAQLIDVRSGSGGGSQPMELVTQVAPGLQWSKQSGQVRGSLDYQLQGNVHSRRSELNKVDNSLSAALRAEAVPGWMYVDGRANIGKQSLSPLGQQSINGSLAGNSNQQEVLNVQMSPYVRGELLDLADYELRLKGGITEVRGSSFGDSTTVGSSITLSSPRRGTVLGWGLQASQDRIDYKGGRATDNFRTTASVSATPDSDWSFVLRAGQESTNVGALSRRTYDNYGAGLRWAPSSRTLVDVSGDRRYFGDSFQVTLEHRLRRSVFRFTSAKDAATSGDADGAGQPLTLFQIYDRLFRSSFPDDQQRRQQVLQFMALNGLNPASVFGSSFATSAVTLQRRDDLSYSYIAPRTTFTLRGTYGTTEIIDNLSSQRGLNFVKQRGVEASVAHRVTPITSATLQGTYQRNSGQGQQDSDVKALSLNLATSVNRHTTATVGARYGVYSGASNSNRETALTGSLSMRF